MAAGSAEAGWILHTRPWRETSLIVELFTAEQGRLGLVARGARRPRRGGRALEPFIELRCQWRGRGELLTLGEHEVAQRLPLRGDALYAGFYLNELLMRLLQREDAHPGLFDVYERALQVLAHLDPGRGASAPLALEPVLRRFEFALLDELGYGFPFDRDLDGNEVCADRSYAVLPDSGVLPLHAGAGVDDGEGEPIAGADLLAIAQGRLETAAVLRIAKRITRAALTPHLGSRPLASRALFARRPPT